MNHTPALLFDSNDADADRGKSTLSSHWMSSARGVSAVFVAPRSPPTVPERPVKRARSLCNPPLPVGVVRSGRNGGQPCPNAWWPLPFCTGAGVAKSFLFFFSSKALIISSCF